ncbi:hypothetical protein CK203_029177 [Vitis vinifera]|uniref:Reverse transcriptase domain-containing protein n=1 Tax=Vitis vinifera TaxID=29760 RepID=A0A438IST7_VITVI|nr:hypothetical protein CK203_029177 [Vitis vinifera]
MARCFSPSSKKPSYGGSESNMGFTLLILEIVGKEVMLFFKNFHPKEVFRHNLNVTFLALVPKKGGADDIKYFKPINMVGNIYKLLAKELVNRLKRVVEKVASDFENAFAGSKQMRFSIKPYLPNGSKGWLLSKRAYGGRSLKGNSGKWKGEWISCEVKEPLVADLWERRDNGGE